MIILTDEFIRRILTNDKEISRKTHLVLSDRSICRLEPLSSYTSFEVIDLRNNKISEMQNLGNMKNMTHLYLQNNHIQMLSGFKSLVSLKVLFLDYNKIEVIEHLDNCPLYKLSLKGQKIGLNVVLGFDPLCMKKLKPHMHELNISDNSIHTIRGINYLTKLEILDISSNKIKELNCFNIELSNLKNLRQLNISNNPIIKNAACLAKTVSACKKLECLNGIPISCQTRIYCENMYKLDTEKPTHVELQILVNAANRSLTNFPVSLRPHLTEKLLNELSKKWKFQKKL